RGYLDQLFHHREFHVAPSAAVGHLSRRRAAKVTHVGRQHCDSAVEKSSRRDSAEVFVDRRVNLGAGADSKQVMQAACVVAVAMRDDNEVELLQVGPKRFNISLEYGGIVSGVE